MRVLIGWVGSGFKPLSMRIHSCHKRLIMHKNTLRVTGDPSDPTSEVFSGYVHGLFVLDLFVLCPAKNSQTLNVAKSNMPRITLRYRSIMVMYKTSAELFFTIMLLVEIF